MTDRGLPARRLACALLQRIIARDTSLDQALRDTGKEQNPQWPPARSNDHAFARAMTRVALRHLGQIDALLATHLRKTPPAPIQDIMRIALAQMLFLQTPAHAAVNSAVAQTAEIPSLSPLRSLVNAILRKCSGQNSHSISVTSNIPAALLESWQNAYGKTQSEKIAAIQGEEAPLDLQFHNRKTRTLWQGKLGGIPLSADSLRLPATGANSRTDATTGEISRLPGYQEGAWWVQDFAASLPVRLFGADMRGRPVLDLCAAPGGKTAQLCALGAQVTAVEGAAQRLQTLRANLKRLNLAAQATIHANILTWRPAQAHPFVLLDAPCSASGTLRRNPDVPWRGRRDWRADAPFLARLLALQRKFLAAAAEMTAPGGVLLYSVCSLQPQECEEQVQHFLESHPHFTRQPISTSLVPFDDLPEVISAGGDLRTLPCHLADMGGMDGFYAARLMRRDSPR